MRRLVDELPPGSFLVLTGDTNPENAEEGFAAYGAHGVAVRARTRAEFEEFFDGLELIEPGVVLVHHWRPDGLGAQVPDSGIGLYGPVARKPL